jgi:hypothetical protein
MRSSVRYLVCYEAELHVGGSSLRCFTHDLHEDGVRVHVTRPLPQAARAGARARVAIDVDGAGPVEFECEVRHVTGRDIGLQFVLPARPSVTGMVYGVG